MLNEGTLVLEGVTLAEEVQLVVQVLVDLSGGAVLDQKAAEDTETAHPEDLAVFRVSNYSMCVCSPHGGPGRVPQVACGGRAGGAYLGIRASLVPFLLPKPR